MKTIFAHGLEGSPEGNKATYSRETFGAVTPDFQGMELFDRVDLLKEHLKENSDVLLIGSSMGGAAALLASHDVKPKKLLLLAPALHYPECQDAGFPEGLETIIIHGTGDEIIPIRYSEVASKKFGCKLIVVEDNHSLRGSKDLIIETVKKMIG